jgi:tRNA(fMet)-specific endonuclease VapC
VKRLLDTSAYARLKRGDESIGELVRSAEHVYVSIVVLGEILFGFHDGGKLERNVEDLDEFLAHPRVSLQYLTRATADRFGRIATALKRSGRPIPTNDIWIAAHAMELGAELVTLDRHFEQVSGLIVLGPQR